MMNSVEQQRTPLAMIGTVTAVSAILHGTALWSISPYLASMSLVYSWAPDAVYGNSTYKNSTMADWALAHGLSTARYPAGEASYWNWEDPSGVMGRSTLDPSFTPADRAPAYQWMSSALRTWMMLLMAHSVCGVLQWRSTWISAPAHVSGPSSG